MRFIRGLWDRVHQPRVISISYFVTYLAFAASGLCTYTYPPMTIAGQIGPIAMKMLAVLLVFGGLVGAVAALPGIWWLERSAVASIGLAFAIYLWIILTLHFTTPGNRILQAAGVFAVGVHQIIRWVRIRERPYRPIDPSRHEV